MNQNQLVHFLTKRLEFIDSMIASAQEKLELIHRILLKNGAWNILSSSNFEFFVISGISISATIFNEVVSISITIAD